jgi:hypothetical protein
MGKETPTLLGPLERGNLNHWTSDVIPTHESLHLEEVAEVKVTLRLTVSQSVCLGVEPTLGLVTRYCFLSEG